MTVLSVCVDSREPPDIIAALGVVGGVAASVAPLPAGDCMVICSDCVLLAERKAPHDLLSSVTDGRLFGQVARMREITPWVYVVVTGSILPDRDGKCWLGQTQTGFSWHSLQGALITAQELGAIVVWANGGDDYLPCLHRLIARSRSTVRLGAVRAGALVPAGEAILTSLPGIGPEAAKALLEYAHTPAWALTWLTGETPADRVAGIGPQKRAAVRQVLGLDASECLHVLVADSAHAALGGASEIKTMPGGSAAA